MICWYRVLNPLKRIDQAVLKEVPDLVLGLVENFLQWLEEWLYLFMRSRKPFLEQVDRLVLLLVLSLELL